LQKQSDTKSNRSFGPFGNASGARAPGAALPHLQFLLSVKPSKAFVVHAISLASQQHMQTTVAEATPLRGESPNTQPGSGVARTTAAVTHRCAIRIQ
jgi:hypothetical protein